jgi:hypothetical protein
MSNPVDIVSNQFANAGLTTQYKRRNKDGTLEDANEKELGKQILTYTSEYICMYVHIDTYRIR